MRVPMAVIPADQQRNREHFGRAITVWMRRNGWSQQTFHNFAVAAEAEGPWNSQISLLQRGRLDCKSLFFVSLARFNQAVSGQKFPKGITRELRDRLTDAEPFRGPDGDVATAMAFYGMFVGELPLPETYALTESFTDDEAVEVCDALRQAFKARATDLMLSPKEAMQELQEHLDASNFRKKDAGHLREVLSGWSDYNGGELQEIHEQLKRAMTSWGTPF